MEAAAIERHTVYDSDHSHDKDGQYKQQVNEFNMRILEKIHIGQWKKNQTNTANKTSKSQPQK